MAKQSGLTDNFFIDGHDLSGDVTSVDTISGSKATLDTPVIESAGMVRLAGHGSGEISFTSWFDDGTNLEHTALAGIPTTDVVVLYTRGVASDSPAAGIVAKQVNYDGAKGSDKSLTMNVQCLANAVPLEWGVLLTAGAITQSSAGSESSKDDSASSSSGIAAYLQMIDINSGTPTITIEHSANNSSWSTLLSFSAVANGNEPAAERKTASGTVNRYLRVTSTGTFSNAKFVIAYRRGESVDDTAY
tara:strand:- start:3728 stop:4465 length:738 start_codon:yes stop_codon:yes gene_type:complete